jgi:predicted protein tyrosine phosphatase
MILPPLTRHVAVCSLGEVQRFLDLDRDFWNVISIRDSTRSKLLLPRAKSVLPLYFDDAEIVEKGSRWIVMSLGQAQEIWRFVNGTGQGPLLIHCVAGLSRSTAVAAAIIAHGLLAAGVPPSETAVETVERLLAVRPPACPNSLVLLRLLECFLEPAVARQIAIGIWEDDRILHNRFVRPH